MLILRSLVDLDVDEVSDDGFSFSISMVFLLFDGQEFSPNDYFFDTKLVRIFSFGINNQLISTSIDVSWKQFQTEKSFFDLFTEMRGCNSQDVSMAIKNDIWPSPFKFVRDSAADKF
ncbi:NAP1-related protein 1-like [Octopus sinensis]|uniref:NAP1-related protein 1-like n=1 Tax=Octopus sinensis TaxID=2607531 RepID=A0A6P7TZC1_9MOLL|nr:NAP1-related protein 1-like [Octopus sinensis]